MNDLLKYILICFSLIVFLFAEIALADNAEIQNVKITKVMVDSADKLTFYFEDLTGNPVVDSYNSLCTSFWGLGGFTAVIDTTQSTLTGIDSPDHLKFLYSHAMAALMSNKTVNIRLMYDPATGSLPECYVKGISISAN